MIEPDFNKEIDDLYKLSTKIFQLIKIQDWKNLNQLILDNDIDYNIMDNSNTYLLEYLIMFNQEDIIKNLLKKNVRIDICDEQNRSILYIVIKFSYYPILELLLEKDNEIIGKSILEITDNEENIPLFYAIKFFNVKAIESIFKYQLNYYNKNNEGENALHLSIKSLDINIFKLANGKMPDINSRKNNGETCIHLAIKYKTYDIMEFILKTYLNSSNKIVLNLNLTESKYNFTPLHYICLTMDYKLISLIQPYINHIDPNIQDKSGNIFYHYFINNIINFFNTNPNEIKSQVIMINDIFKKIIFNYNIYNIDGNTPLHIMLLNLNIFKNNFDILINDLIAKTDLNIQNKNGESCLFLLIKKDYWKDVSNILVNKKLDIFIIDNDKTTFFNHINSDDIESFINIVTSSYLNLIINNDYGKKWIDYWDNRCKKNIKLQELNETEIELIHNLKIDSNKDLCFQIIYDKLKKFIGDFVKNKKIQDVHSYPISIKYPILIKEYQDVLLPTFTGSTIDIISGLIYLNSKYINNISSSLKLVELSKPIVLCNQESKICEIMGFEILWKNYQLFIPSNKLTDLMRELTWIKINKNVRFFCVPIGIEIYKNNNNYGHANYLIFDFVTMEIERFEPHGFDAPYGLDYNPNLLDNILENKFSSYKLGFKYIPPSNYLPKIGFQSKEIYELKSDYIGDPNGFCAVWCIWWVDIRIANPDISRTKLVNLLTKEIINKDYSYKKLIRDYSSYLTDIRDKILNKANININNWINDNINPHNLELLNQTLQKEIQNLVN
jgi:ankyrin repeat protein